MRLPFVAPAKIIAGGPATHPSATTEMSHEMYSIMSRIVVTQYCVPFVQLRKIRMSFVGSSYCSARSSAHTRVATSSSIRSPMKMILFIINALKQSIIWPCAVLTATGTGGSPREPALVVVAEVRTGRLVFLPIAAVLICLELAARLLVNALVAVAIEVEVHAHDIVAYR